MCGSGSWGQVGRRLLPNRDGHNTDAGRIVGTLEQEIPVTVPRRTSLSSPPRLSVWLAALLLASIPPSGTSSLAAQDVSAERDAMFMRYWSFAGLVKGGVVQPNWLSDGSRFWYATGGPDSTGITLVDPAANQARPLFDVARLRDALETALGHRPPYDGVPFETLELTEEPALDRPGRARFVVEDTEYEVGLEDYVVRATGRSATTRERSTPRLIREAFPSTSTDLYETPSPDGRWFLGDDEQDLWLRAYSDDREEPLTQDGEEWFTWTAGGAAWSPSSVRVAALKIDNRHVLKIPLVHWLKPHEEVEWWSFTKAGGALPRPELHIVDVLSKRDVAVDVGEDPEIYLSILDWTSDGSELLFYRMNRAFNRLDLMAADPLTGASRVILTETQPTFIKGINQNPGWSSLARLLSDGERLLWISERDGWDHIYLYDLRGAMIRRLTRGAWPVVGIAAVDEQNGWVYFR
ncbi:MAG: DPP IV N-terminal domain-containing protein, partial [Gemmatimonadota bacterium]|nr:DPP IV N-terminal domain-containing protein [Gemmatimonadota bacterium]